MLGIVITTILFANGLGLFLMWMCGSKKNVESRTERELQIIEEHNQNS